MKKDQATSIHWGKSGAEHDKFDEHANKVHISEFGLKELVYIKTDPDQYQRLITEIEFRGNGSVLYSLTCGTTVSSHYDFELTREPDILKKC
jgi:hypothetical protein